MGSYLTGSTNSSPQISEVAFTTIINYSFTLMFQSKIFKVGNAACFAMSDGTTQSISEFQVEIEPRTSINTGLML